MVKYIVVDGTETTEHDTLERALDEARENADYLEVYEVIAKHHSPKPVFKRKVFVYCHW
jgi:flavin-binding protein dodecin